MGAGATSGTGTRRVSTRPLLSRHLSERRPFLFLSVGFFSSLEHLHFHSHPHPQPPPPPHPQLHSRSLMNGLCCVSELGFDENLKKT